MKTRYIVSMLIFCVVVFLGVSAVADLPGIQVDNLRCEWIENPIGIDTVRPCLSWKMMPVTSGVRGQKQTAYQILVADTPEKLTAGNGNLWNTGKIVSDQSIHIEYAGSSLTSEMRCYWKVRVWDKDDQVSNWSSAASWTMGLLNQSDWQGQWIKPTPSELDWNDAQWIWYPDGDPVSGVSAGTRYFRRSFTISDISEVENAPCIITADDQFELFVNGQSVYSDSEVDGWRSAEVFDIAPYLQNGDNVLAVRTVNASYGAASWIAAITVNLQSGPLDLNTGHLWLTNNSYDTNWETVTYDDSSWGGAQEVGQMGIGPWYTVSSISGGNPAYLIRHNFSISKEVEHATAYISGISLSELYLNGDKVGDHVLSPGLTDYRKTVFYVTYDITSMLNQGDNAVGVMLAGGRLTQNGWATFPQMIVQIAIAYEDGTKDVISSNTNWKCTDKGPIRDHHEYHGETYDARMEISGWSTAGFDDSDWGACNNGDFGFGTLKSQFIDPIRVTETLTPVSVKQVSPGVYIYDMGQNMVGWCQLTVEGDAGTAVTLRYAEDVADDGTLDTFSMRNSEATDEYTLKGQGVEVYEPRFTYRGFRYVEVTGFSGTPTIDSLRGRVVHDDMKKIGDFECSNSLLNQIYKNVVWGVRGNSRSIPTDCPQRDERQGWLGDVVAHSESGSYFYDNYRFYEKWMTDIKETQFPDGRLPAIAPGYWGMDMDDVTWPSTYVMITNWLYSRYGDIRVVRDNYDAMKAWTDHVKNLVQSDNTIHKDTFGDWCTPPEDPTLPVCEEYRKTSGTILSTTYFYYDVECMARFAGLLGKSTDQAEFLSLAATLRDGLNTALFDYANNQYDNGTHTSYVLPLGFGMVPDSHRQQVIDSLVNDIMVVQNGHTVTGLIGAQWLTRALADRPDVIYAVATQTTYPSLGYMIENGATTFWELWNADTAQNLDQFYNINSKNHLMLAGDLVLWFYEGLAGIQCDPEQPAYKHVIIKPQLISNLTYVHAHTDSPHGPIASSWQANNDTYTLSIDVPVNTTATVYVPISSFRPNVTETGVAAAQAEGVTVLAEEDDCRVYSVQPGHYEFTTTVPWFSETLSGDYIQDGVVDMHDFAYLAKKWKAGDYAADVDGNNIVNLYDLVQWCQNWLSKELN